MYLFRCIGECVSGRSAFDGKGPCRRYVVSGKVLILHFTLTTFYTNTTLRSSALYTH